MTAFGELRYAKRSQISAKAADDPSPPLTFFGLSVLNSILGWRLYVRWRRVRIVGSGGLPLNQSLLNAIENNQQTLEGHSWYYRDWTRSWTILRVLLCGEHRAIADPVLTRRVYTLRFTMLLAFAILVLPFVAPR